MESLKNKTCVCRHARYENIELHRHIHLKQLSEIVERLKKECEREIHPNMEADGSEGVPCWHCNKIDLAFESKVSLDEARKKFKQLAKRYHPDINKDPKLNKNFGMIKKALEMIEDENK